MQLLTAEPTPPPPISTAWNSIHRQSACSRRDNGGCDGAQLCANARCQRDPDRQVSVPLSLLPAVCLHGLDQGEHPEEGVCLLHGGWQVGVQGRLRA